MEKFQIKHTPGPFYAVDYAGFIQLHTEPYYGEKDILNTSVCPEAPFNAALFAAAPDLLDALIETWTDLSILKSNLAIAAQSNSRFDGYPEQVQKWIDRNEAAISKALNPQP